MFVPVQAGSWRSGLPDGPCPCPGFPAGGRRRRSAACSGPSGFPPDGDTAVVYATPAALLAEGCLPCGRRRRPALSGGQAGSEAQVRPRRPRPAPAVLPMQPVATAPRGQPLASTHACPTRIGVAPVSSLLLLQRLREPPVRMVEHPTGPFASDSQRSSLRGVVRPHAGPKPCAGRHPRAADHREDQPNPRPLPDVEAGPRRCLQPSALRPPVHRHRPPPVRPTLPPKRPRHRLPDGRGKERRTWTASSPFGGRRDPCGARPGEVVIGACSCCRVRSTSWAAWPGKTIATRACLRRRSLRSRIPPCGDPVGRGGGPKTDAMRRMSPRVNPGSPSSSAHLAGAACGLSAFDGSHERRSESFVRPLRAAACAACPGGRAPGK